MIFLIPALALLMAAYLFAIMPRMTGKPSTAFLMGRHYAHRGLHDNETNAPENSIAAFEKAVDAGYGVELDVQLTRDRIPVVFHDENLLRVCGASGNVRDYTYAELCQFPLMRSNQRIPLLSEVLETVNGRVPLIIEIKAHEPAAEVCAWSDKQIAAYNGPYCIESFDPRVVAWYRKNRPEVVRGQLASNFNRLGKPEKFTHMLVHHLLINFMGRPDFIAYEYLHKSNLSRILCRRLFGALSIAWTLRSQPDLDAVKKDFDLFIFEKFIPKA